MVFMLEKMAHTRQKPILHDSSHSFTCFVSFDAYFRFGDHYFRAFFYVFVLLDLRVQELSSGVLRLKVDGIRHFGQNAKMNKWQKIYTRPKMIYQMVFIQSTVNKVFFLLSHPHVFSSPNSTSMYS